MHLTLLFIDDNIVANVNICFNGDVLIHLWLMVLGRYGGEYGQQRVWGSIGWGTVAMFAGLLMDVASGQNPIQNYAPAFLLTLAISVTDIIVLSRIRVSFSLAWVFINIKLVLRCMLVDLCYPKQLTNHYTFWVRKNLL